MASLWPEGVGHSIMWPTWGCAAGQSMVFGLSALVRVYNFRRVCPSSVRICPKQGKVAQLLSLNTVCSKWGTKLDGDVLLRTQSRYFRSIQI